MWLGSGTAAIIVGVHIAVYHVALGFGSASLLGYATRWLSPS